MRLFIGPSVFDRLSIGPALPPGGGLAIGWAYDLDVRSWKYQTWWLK